MTTVEKLMLVHRSKLLAFVRRRVSDADLAEDVLQDGLLKAVRSAGDLRDEDRLIPWFLRILNNAIIDTYRKRDTDARRLSAFARQAASETDAGDVAALCECFRSVLPTLKPEYAELIERLELQEGDPGQVAEQLKIKPGNLKVRRHRARQALRRRLEETCRTCAVHGCLDCTCGA